MQKNLKRALVVGAIVLAGATLGARPTFAAENIFQRVQSSVRSKLDGFYLRWVPGTKSGKLVLKQMATSYQNLKSFESNTTVDAQILGDGQTLGTANLSVVGPTTVGSTWDPKTYKQDMKLSANVSFEGTSLSAAAEMKAIDGVSYVMLTQVPTFPGLPIDLSTLKNAWIKIDPAQSAAGANTTPVVLSADQQQRMQAAMQKLLESSQVSDAQPENKDGENTFKLEVMLAKPAVVEYLMTVNAVQKEVVSADLEKMGVVPPSEAEQRQTYENMLANVGDLKATVWVERSHYYPTYFELPLEIDVKKAVESGTSLPPTAASVEKINLMITADLSKFNESFTITAPEKSEDIQLFMQRIVGGSMGASAYGTPELESTTMVPAPSKLRQPTVGTSELPELTEWQKQQLEMYDNR